MSALGAALYGIGIPRNSVIRYETEVGNDEFLVMAHGGAHEVARAKAMLAAANPARLDRHQTANVTDVVARVA